MSILYHGTSETLARVIVNDGLIPAKTTPTLANSNVVYLAQNAMVAVVFGYMRVMMRQHLDSRGIPILNEFHPWKKYGRIALIEIDSERLNQSLLGETDRFSGFPDLMYEGTVPVSALRQVHILPINKELRRQYLQIAPLFSVGRKADFKPMNFSLQPDETWDLENTHAQ